jgi:hypothetical protein
MPNLKPYRTKAQRAEARHTARKDKDGAWRSDAPFSIHGQPGEWVWDASHKIPVRKSDRDEAADHTAAADERGEPRRRIVRRRW